MTIEEIKELIHVVHETGIAELEVQRGDNRVRIRSASPAAKQEVLHQVHTSPALPGTAAPLPPPSVTAEGVETAEDTNVVVKSPIVGTYYDSPAPGAAPFVKIGDHIEVGKVLCIIESMKLMNEIEAEFAGVVVSKSVENGKPVEYGEPLLTVRPLNP